MLTYAVETQFNEGRQSFKTKDKTMARDCAWDTFVTFRGDCVVVVKVYLFGFIPVNRVVLH